MAPMLALALTLMAADVHGVTVQTNRPQATSDAQADRDKIVCRHQPITGSRITKRICMTQGHWDDWAKRSDAYLNSLKEQSTLGMPAVPGQMN